MLWYINLSEFEINNFVNGVVYWDPGINLSWSQDSVRDCRI